MDTLTIPPIAGQLARLFRQAEAADRSLVEALGNDGSASFDEPAFTNEAFQKLLDDEARDYKAVYRGYAGNYLAVSPEFGRFLYLCARARGARRVVEFGTSFGISAIHLACALRDRGDGGRLIGTELEASKAAAARANLAAAGLADLVEIRVGDALETLRAGVGGEVDLVHLDGAFSLYLPILKLLEPHLAAGAVVIGENAFGEYLDYVRDPRNGYLSVALPFDAGRGNEFTVLTR